MQKQIITICTLFFLSACTFAQTENQETEQPYIEITGTAERSITPDEIYIHIHMEERLSGRDKITLDQQEQQLQQGLKQLNISLDQLKILGSSSDYAQRSWSKNQNISQRNYELLVHNAQEVDEVLHLIDQLKIHSADINRVDHSEIESIKKEVRIQAITAAKDKADYLLQALGAQRGKPLIVREQSGNPRWDPMSNIALDGIPISANSLEQREYKAELDPLITIGDMLVKSSMYVKFLIE